MNCGVSRFLLAGAGLGLFATPLFAHDQWDHGDENKGRRQVVIISLDGAKPDVIERFLRNGVLDRDGGLGTLARNGVVAEQNITATPSLTAVSHIAIATGSTA